ncbi:hypothetical protein CROQUDRAFT_111271 [Cronartium quercuum f. sp. fusiforme G11]|uniref:Uncharacterized protein n=1 Tax=Cronartium quercuum f. sp. fusiforme G11 TaxID=708437 RepID=A0A9P6NAE4_9BASI|nr:hypothetical protein CROQUDRAFT_111271 [Cronartium quercuum f. sp. fusiforme G11]
MSPQDSIQKRCKPLKSLRISKNGKSTLSELSNISVYACNTTLHSLEPIKKIETVILPPKKLLPSKVIETSIIKSAMKSSPNKPNEISNHRFEIIEQKNQDSLNINYQANLPSFLSQESSSSSSSFSPSSRKILRFDETGILNNNYNNDNNKFINESFQNIHFTHSPFDYDRSKIQVDFSLQLPPRTKHQEEEEEEENDGILLKKFESDSFHSLSGF